MTRARRQERRQQRQARRLVRRSNRADRRSDRKENRAERRDARAQRIRNRGGNVRRAQRIENRADRTQVRANRAAARADRLQGRAEAVMGGSADTIRVEARLLTDDQWARFKNALRILKDTPGYWEDLVEDHMVAMDFAHSNPTTYGFLPWHRQYLLELEEDLREIDDNIRIPYWDWRSRRRVPRHMMQDDWMKINGRRDRLASAPGRKVRLNKIETYGTFEEMSDMLEGLHNSIHATLGNTDMSTMNSPNDPLFFMHHAFVDKMWDFWQANNPTIAESHPFPNLLLPGFNGETTADVLDNDDLGVDYL